MWRRADRAERKAIRIRRRFVRDCKRLGIPEDVAGRIWKMTDKAPDWYAGRKDSCYRDLKWHLK